MAAIIHIFGVGSALLILSDRAMREPLAVEWVTGTDSHVFAVYDRHKSKLRKRCALGVGRHKKLSIMNKFLLSLMSFLMMTMCVCSFTACSSDDDDDDAPAAEPVATSPIVGTWVEHDEYSAYVLVTKFVFGADGKGSRTIRWEYKNGSSPESRDPEHFNYTYNSETQVINIKYEKSSGMLRGEASITGNTLILIFPYDDSYITYNLVKQ